uniref:ATP-dependent DNA helicase n=1 Tax=Nelumbo nucifera TaxID=4432 RepID=A0A822XTT5_NELNU|nr:TPA_asm: hypothetical protein HUJ06_026498 [Nelumbo nucifera]
MWIQEWLPSSSISSISNPIFYLCCLDGKVKLPLLPETPSVLQDLFEGKYDTTKSKFNELIRVYNSMCSFTSMGGKIDYQLIQGRELAYWYLSKENAQSLHSYIYIYIYIYIIYIYIYIYDTEHEIANSLSSIHNDQIGAELDPNIVHDIQMMLNQINPYAKFFRSARDLQYNKPSCNEVAALMVGDGSQSINRHDVIVSTLDNRLKRIDKTYPYGWKLDIPYQCVPCARSQHQHMVTLRDFTAYRIHNRLNEGKTLLQGGRAFQQYLVDCYAAIEDDRLRYCKSNQKQLRSEVCQGIQDAINVGDTNASLIGRRYILPSSFTELPNKNDNPLLYETIVKFMIHGPCGNQNPSSPCMIASKCKSHYPRQFFVETSENSWNSSSDNRWVAPYNKDLSRKYNAHINVEIGFDKENLVIHKLPTSHPRETNSYKQIDEIQQYKNPPIERLQYHLEDQQVLVFYDHQSLEREKSRPGIERTIALTYVDFPRYWGMVIGRLYYAHPSSGERYYLRELLQIAHGATSFEDMRTVNGVTHDFYKAACITLGLLDNDNEWDYALIEASIWATSNQMHDIFVSILLINEIANPRQLWNNHWKKSKNSQIQLTDNELQNWALLEIETILNQNNKSLTNYLGMPTPSNNLIHGNLNRLIWQELSYDVTTLKVEFEHIYDPLNPQQRLVFNKIMHACMGNIGGFFFVYGSSGTDKTYLWRALILKLRSEQKIVVATATSGIAPFILPGVKTTHSTFKIPIDLNETSTSNMIIRDEALMAHRYVFEVLDRTLKDLMKPFDPAASDKVFDGKTSVLGGDFRQILLVYLPNLNQKTLNKLHLLQIRSSKLENGDIIGIFTLEYVEPDWIPIPDDILLEDTRDGASPLVNNEKYLCERASFAPRNNEVNAINSYILSLIPGNECTYLSADTISNTNDVSPSYLNLYLPEYLNSLNFPGIPNHSLNQSCGLCNGTRLVVEALGKHVIEAKVITGNRISQTIFIPKIIMSPIEISLPFQLKRRQFPIKLALGMTINKSQGQTLKHVGVCLENPVFSHDQLYVVVSRVSFRSGLKILLIKKNERPTGFTRNVVDKEVFSELNRHSY